MRSSTTGPNELPHDPTTEEPIDLVGIYEESTHEVDPEWLARFGEEDWYAAITLFGLWHVNDNDLPEEYRWPGRSRRAARRAGEEPS